MAKSVKSAGGPPEPKRLKRKRRRRVIFMAAGAAVLLLVVLVLVAPTVASRFVPGIAEREISKSITGRVDVRGAGFSWWGGQRIGPVVIEDAAGNKVAEITLQLSKSLWSLAAGLMGSQLDLGRARVSGEATIVRGIDGTTNIERLIAPQPKKAQTGAGQIPDITGTLVLDALDITFIDQAKADQQLPGAVVRIPNLTGQASISRGRSAVLNLNADLRHAAAMGQEPVPGGSLAIVGQFDNFADAAGNFDPTGLAVETKLDARDLAPVIADTLAGMENRLASTLGERLQASVQASGTLKNSSLLIKLVSRSVNADLSLGTDAGVLTAPRPGQISIGGPAMMALAPRLAGALERNREELVIADWPDVSLSLNRLRIPVMNTGGKVMLSGASLDAAIQTGAITGRVAVFGPEGQRGDLQPFEIAPLLATVTSADLAQGLSIRAATSAQLAGQPAGAFALDLAAAGMADQGGALRQGLPASLDATARLDQVATAIAQPLVEELGISLIEDVGPQVNLVIRAATSESGSESRPESATLPPMSLAVDLESANLRSAARLLYDGRLLTGGDEGVQFEMQRVGPLADRLLTDSGVDVASAGPIRLRVSDLTVDPARLRGEGGPDLRGFAGAVTLEAGASAGTIAVPDRPQTRWSLEPVSVEIDAKNLAEGLSVKAATSAKLEGESAGVLDLDLVATDLLGMDGTRSARMPVVNGHASLIGIATEVAQPIAESYGLNLPSGVGPRLDLRLTAATKPGQGGDIASDLDLEIRSVNLNADAAVTVERRTIRTRGEGVVLTLKSPASLIGPAAIDSGVSMSEGGYVKLTARDLNLPLQSEGTLLLDGATGAIELTTGGYQVRPLPGRAPGQREGELPPPAGNPVEIRQIIVSGVLRPGDAPVVDLKGSGAHSRADFFMQGRIEAHGIGSATGPRPLGTLELRNLPTTLIALVSGIGQQQEQRDDSANFDIATLLRDVVGPGITVNIAATRPEGAEELARTIDLGLASRGLNGEAKFALTAASMSLNALDVRATVSPEFAARVADTLGPQLASKPAIDGPATIRLTSTPLTIPLKGAAPDLAQAGTATITLALEGETIVRDIAFAQDEGPPRPIGPVGFKDVQVALTAPVGAWSGTQQRPAPAEIALKGSASGEGGAELISLSGGGKVLLAGLAPAGDLTANFDLGVPNARLLDRILDQNGLLANGLGEQLRMRGGVTVKFPQPEPLPTEKGQPPKPVRPWWDQYLRADLQAVIDAPKLSSERPLEAVLLQDRLTIEHPMVVRWRMEPSWANWYLFQAGAVGTEQDEQVQVTSPADVVLTLSKLSLAAGKNAGPMQPEIFALDLQVATEGAALTIGGLPASFRNLRTRLTGGREPGTLGVSLRIEDAGGGKPEGRDAVDLAGAAYSVADEKGNLTPDKALLSLNGTAIGFPTPLIDAAAKQDGLLVDALGPITNAELKTRGLSRTGGNVEAVMTSARAEARLAGTIHRGALRLTGPGTATLKVITPELGQRFTKGVPIIGLFEKTSAQAPAVITATDLVVPLDGRMGKLNGEISADLGEASFATSNVFAKLLKVAGARGAGTVGRKLEPFTVTISNGVASYERFSLPLGEFRVDTSGTIDLVSRKLDVVTYVPLGAVTDEVAGVFNSGLGAVLGGAIPTIETATMVPIRTSGPFDNPQTRPDVELFARNLGATLLRPDKLIGGSVKDLFERIGGGSNRPR